MLSDGAPVGGKSRRLRPILLCVIVVSPLLGWLSWPAAGPVLVGAVELGRSCPQPTRQWADGVSTGARVRRVSVLCRPDGGTYAVTLVRERAVAGGYQRLAWHPLPTFLGTLPARATERVDVLDEVGRLVEYATVDREARLVEFHDADGRLTGSGRLDPSSGRVERIDGAGQRRTAIVLPIPP
jgi:hypothetical protein